MSDLSKKQIIEKLNSTEKTIRNDIEFLELEPSEISDYQANLYSEKDVQLIAKLREHCNQGKSRTTFLPPVEAEVVSHIAIAKPDDMDSFISSGLEVNPLFRCQVLQELYDKKWMPPTRQLAQIIGVTTKTLLANSPYEFWGFICTRNNSKNHNTYSWKIEKKIF